MALAASIQATMVADLQSATIDCPSVLEWRREKVTGTSSPSETGRDVDETGAMVTVDVEWAGLRGDFGGKTPGAGDIVRVDGTRYAVATATDDGVALALGLQRLTEEA